MRAVDQEPARPALPDQDTGPARRPSSRARARCGTCCESTVSVRSSSSSARPLKTSAPACIGQRSDGQQVGSLQVGDEQPLARGERRLELGRRGRRRPATIRSLRLYSCLRKRPVVWLSRIALLRALDALVGQDRLDQRQRDRRRLLPAEIGDRDVELGGRAPANTIGGNQRRAPANSSRAATTSMRAYPVVAVPEGVAGELACAHAIGKDVWMSISDSLWLDVIAAA